MHLWERKILDFLMRHMAGIVFLLITAAAIYVRMSGMNYSSGDYSESLYPWFQELKSYGGLKGLGYKIGDYYVPYLLLLALMTYLPFSPLLMIKVLSIFFEFVCALVAMKLAHDISGKKTVAMAVYAVVILSPIVVLNGAFWGQCDYIYGAFILGSIYFFRQKKFSRSFIFLGIAFIFKLQAIFILPLYILYYLLNREFSAIKFFWMPLIYFIAGMPAGWAGRSRRSVYMTYFGQVDNYWTLSANVPNVWSVFPVGQHETFQALGICAVVVIMAVLAFYLLNEGYRLNFKTFLLMGVVTEGICVMVLPGMHERYVAVYCLLATVYFTIYDWKKIGLALLANFIALPTYMSYLYGVDMTNIYLPLSFMNVALLLYLIYYALEVIRKEKAAIHR